MEIKNTSGLASNVAGKQELKEIKTAKNAKSFTLRLENDGRIDRETFKRLLTAARVSKAYKNNFDKYQFTIKSDRNGQYLSLKRQGLWSRFKGLIGFGSTERQEQRAQARNVIESALKFSERVYLRGQPDEGISPLDTRLTKAQAVEFQAKLMNESSISPVRHYNLDQLGGSPQNQRLSEEGREPNALSGPITFNDLMRDDPPFVQEQVEARRSAEPVPDDDRPQVEASLPGRPQAQLVNWLREQSIGLAEDLQSLGGDQQNSIGAVSERQRLGGDQRNSIGSASERQSLVGDRLSERSSVAGSEADLDGYEEGVINNYLFTHVFRSGESNEGQS